MRVRTIQFNAADYDINCTIPENAVRLGVSAASVYRLIKDGVLPRNNFVPRRLVGSMRHAAEVSINVSRHVSDDPKPHSDRGDHKYGPAWDFPAVWV